MSNSGHWDEAAQDFLLRLQREELSASRADAETPTLYGSVYAYLALFYLGANSSENKRLKSYVAHHQDDEGLLVGPELEGFVAQEGVLHDYAHLSRHSSCSVLPFAQQFGVPIQPLKWAHEFCEPAKLQKWCESIDWKNAWFEGNNILFVGQALLYLRDVERHEGAGDALEAWFRWLDEEVDPSTSLWGTNGFCGSAEAVYGGYHQLLLYWHEERPLPNLEGLVDTVLSLQHWQGGFNPAGNAGACEDVDSVDILVHCYKRLDYRRVEIAAALRSCVDHILRTQNPDGGFPYNRDRRQSHMGIPGTEAEPNVSCTFPTWFRVHTLALCAEIIPDHPALAGRTFRFNEALSMGWHASPAGWTLEKSDSQLQEELVLHSQFEASRVMRENRMRRMAPFIRIRKKGRALKKRLKRFVCN